MRTRYTLITALTSLTATAQVVFELPNALPDNGVHQRQQWEGLYTGFPITGTNVIWDLTTGLTPFGSTVPTLFAPPLTTPGALDFPNATHAQGDVYIPGDTTWLYYRSTGDSLWIDGARYQGGELWTCDSPYLIAYFPYSIGDLAECNTNCSYNGDPPVFLNQGFKPVATGTILYPGGSYTNVVLVEYFYYGASGETYSWLSMDNILLTYGQFYADYASLWLPATGIGMDEYAATTLTAYPVPASEEVFIGTAGLQDALRYQVLDATGRVVQQGPAAASADRLRIDVGTWPAGQYVMRLLGNGSVHHARISVEH